MGIIKLSLEDFLEAVDYTLIAIHSRLEDYRLVYNLNKKLNINLARKPKDINYKNNDYAFSLFEWKNIQQDIKWNVISNIHKQENNYNMLNTPVLFTTPYTKTVYLLPEFKTVNYFLKVSNDNRVLNIPEVIQTINTISQVITAYIIDTDKIQSKERLIFD